MIRYAAAFGLTVASESVLLWLLWRDRPVRLLGYMLLINAVTHPPATYLYAERQVPLLVVEVGVVIVESVLLMALLEVPYRRALLLAAFLNGVSSLLSFAL